ncbi:MAG: type II toxin-antitoxin system RelE/ParE family toxin [bacterium]
MGYLIKYFKHNNEEPIEEYLSNSDETTRGKIVRQIAYIYEYGINPNIPRFKKLVGYNIWEARVLGKDNIRIFCCSNLGVIYILHIFRKKSQKTQKKDLQIGEKRYNIVLTGNIQ